MSSSMQPPLICPNFKSFKASASASASSSSSSAASLSPTSTQATQVADLKLSFSDAITSNGEVRLPNVDSTSSSTPAPAGILLSSPLSFSMSCSLPATRLTQATHASGQDTMYDLLANLPLPSPAEKLLPTSSSSTQKSPFTKLSSLATGNVTPSSLETDPMFTHFLSLSEANVLSLYNDSPATDPFAPSGLDYLGDLSTVAAPALGDTSTANGVATGDDPIVGAAAHQQSSLHGLFGVTALDGSSSCMQSGDMKPALISEDSLDQILNSCALDSAASSCAPCQTPPKGFLSPIVASLKSVASPAVAASAASSAGASGVLTTPTPVFNKSPIPCRSPIYAQHLFKQSFAQHSHVSVAPLVDSISFPSASRDALTCISPKSPPPAHGIVSRKRLHSPSGGFSRGGAPASKFTHHSSLSGGASSGSRLPPAIVNFMGGLSRHSPKKLQAPSVVARALDTSSSSLQHSVRNSIRVSQSQAGVRSPPKTSHPIIIGNGVVNSGAIPGSYYERRAASQVLSAISTIHLPAPSSLYGCAVAATDSTRALLSSSLALNKSIFTDSSTAATVTSKRSTAAAAAPTAFQPIPLIVRNVREVRNNRNVVVRSNDVRRVMQLNGPYRNHQPLQPIQAVMQQRTQRQTLQRRQRLLLQPQRPVAASVKPLPAPLPPPPPPPPPPPMPLTLPNSSNSL